MKREEIDDAAELAADRVSHYKTTDLISFANGFVDGAEWRINSVWHDMKEIPKVGKIIILVNEEGQGVIILVFPSTDINNLPFTMKFVRWSYLYDLLPTKED